MDREKQARLSRLVQETRAFADECDKRDFTAEDSVKLKRMTDEVTALAAEVTADGERDGQLNDAKSFLSSLAGDPGDGGSVGSSKMAVPTHTALGMPMNPAGKTLGQMFTESEEFRSFLGTYSKGGGRIPDSTKGIQSPTYFAGGDTKTLVTGVSDTQGGAFIRTDRQGGVVDLVPPRELTLYDLITKGQTDSDTIDYVRITGRTNNAAGVPEATTSGQPALYNAPTGPEIIAGGYKPESGFALDTVSTTVKTIAHWMPITKRAASDAGQVRTMIDAFLRQGLNEKLEDYIISGPGTGETFTGIMNSGILTVGSAGTDIDAVVDAIRTVRVTGRRRPNALVIHPDDWYSAGFLLAKDSQGNYLLANPGAGIDQLSQLWGLRVVVSEGITANTALVGDFSYAVLWEREGISLSVSDSHLDFFTRNLLAILAEMRAGFGVLDSQAFCSVTAV